MWRWNRVVSKTGGLAMLLTWGLTGGRAPEAWAGGDIIDDFNRPGPELGSNWAADVEYQILDQELANATGLPVVEYIAAYNAVSNPLAVAYRWSPSSDVTGRNQAGFALRLDIPSPDASGYLLYRDDPANGFPNQWVLVRISNGVWAGILQRQLSSHPQVPGPNDVIKAVLSSDVGGHHFDLFVNGVHDTRITDPDRIAGNSPVWYSGFMSMGQMNNRIDDFTLTMEPPPSSFALLAPPNDAVDVPQQPDFQWESAGASGLPYTVYVATDSVGAPVDSAGVAGTSLQWPTSLAAATDWVWRVRATNGQESLFNSGGWYRFRTTVSAVEPATFGRIKATYLSN